MKPLLSIILMFLLWYPVHCLAAWEDSGSRDKWVAIVIDKDEVDAALSDFAVLLNEDVFVTNAPNMLDSDETDHCAQNGGGDIRFSSTEPTAADGTGATQIACEIVSFVTNSTPASATVEIWVPISSLSSVADTTIYCAWHTSGTSSQPATDATYGAESVWSDFDFVSHLEDLTAGTVKDSTASGFTCEKTSSFFPVEDTGQIGKGQNFDAIDIAYITVGENSDLQFADGQAFSFSSWTKSSSTGNYSGIISKYIPTGAFYILQFQTDGDIRCQIRDDGSVNNSTATSSGTNYEDGNWHLVHGTFDGTSINTLYIDGASAASNTLALGEINPNGQLCLGGRSVDVSRPLDGSSDEARVISSELSSSWISTEYNNQKSPSTFASSGSIQTLGSTPATGNPRGMFFIY